MPFIRYTYPADVEVHGSEPIEVPEVSAKVLVVERRRAELVEMPPADQLECADCPEGDCADCPLAP